MRFQQYEKKFLTDFENIVGFKVPEDDTSMLIKIWRRKNHCSDGFEIGGVLYTIEFFYIDNTFIYIQDGKYKNNLTEVDTNRSFLALRQEKRRETSAGVPIFSVFAYNPK